jgi:hypothetical protein
VLIDLFFEVLKVFQELRSCLLFPIVECHKYTSVVIKPRRNVGNRVIPIMGEAVKNCGGIAAPANSV